MTDSTMTTSQTNPYVGPRSFGETDADRFFGRANETIQLTNLVIAHRDVLLYAQSGAGKTSLIQASVVPALKQRRQIITLPIARVSGADRQDVANIYIFNTLLNIHGDEADPAALAALTLADGLASLFAGVANERLPRLRLLIIDQFEELFTTYPEQYEKRAGFFDQLEEALAQYPQLSLLLSMREDYVAHLDSFSGRLPSRLRTRFRLERLGPEAAQEAVVKPLAQTSRSYARGVAQLLVDNLRRVQRRVVTAGGSEVTYVVGQHVEPVHLQIVCRQLWENLPPDRNIIQLEDIQQFGDVDEALTQFYEAALASALAVAPLGQRRLRRWFDSQLITPAQTRGLLYRGETETAGLSNIALDVLNEAYIVRADIRGGETWYELSHDRLVDPILAANAAWREVNANPLTVAVSAWLAAERADSELATGTQLAELETYAAANAAEVTEDERLFLDESHRVENNRKTAAAQRNQRRVILGSLALVIVLTALTIIAIVSASRASANSTAANATGDAANATGEAADELRVTAEWNSEIAQKNELLADEAASAALATGQAADVLRITSEWNASQAIQLKTQVQASQLAAASMAELNNDQELALLLATTALGLSQQSDTEASFYTALQTPYRGTIGRSTQVRSSVFSKDGSLIITTGCKTLNDEMECLEGIAQLWATGHTEPITLFGHTDWVETAVFGPQAELIATASDDGTVRLWNRSGEYQATLTGHPGGVRTVAFSPDGTQILTGGCDTLAADGSCSNGSAKLWSLSGIELMAPITHFGWVTAAFSPSGHMVLTAGSDGDARIWNSLSGEISTLTGGSSTPGILVTAEFNPNGDSILTAGDDGMARLWSLDGGLIVEIDAGWGFVSAHFSPDGDRIVSSAYFLGNAHVWDLSGSLQANLETRLTDITSARFSPTGEHIVTVGCKARPSNVCTDSSVQVWDRNGNLLHILEQFPDTVLSATFSPEGSLLITSSGSGPAIVWGLSDENKEIVAPNIGFIRSLDITRDNTILASGDRSTSQWEQRDSTVWNSSTFDFLANHDVWSIDTSPNGNLIVSARCSQFDSTARSMDGCVASQVHIWAQSGLEIAELIGHTNAVFQAQFSPDGETILTASGDGTARLWNVDGTELGIVANHSDWVISARFSPDGRSVVTSSWDGSVSLWDLSGNLQTTFEGHEGTVWEAAFSPDGTQIATASSDHTVRIWSISGQLLSVLKGHSGAVRSVAFSPDGSRIVTAGDNTVRLWRLSGVEIGTFVLEYPRLVRFSSDGTMIVATDFDSIVQWPSLLSLESKWNAAIQRLSRAFSEEECVRFFPIDEREMCPTTLTDLLALFDS